MKTLPKQTSLFTEEKSTSLQADSHANRIHQQVKDLVRKTIDISGRRCLEQFERFSPGTSWEKMFMDSLIGMGDWFSTRCKLTWKMKGTKYNRLYFQLVPSTLPIEEIEFGLWPTPTSVQRDHPERVEKLKATGAKTMMSRAAGENRPNSIIDAAMFYELIPTPTANPSARKLNENGKSVAKNGKRYGTSIKQWAEQKMLATPQARDWKGAQGRAYKGEAFDLPSQTGANGQLNPQFVAEMMGFPTNWTELPFQSGDKNQ